MTMDMADRTPEDHPEPPRAAIKIPIVIKNAAIVKIIRATI